MSRPVYEKAFATERIEKYILIIKRILRTTLIISSCLLLFSSILILFFGKISSENYHENYTIIIWYATLFSLYAFICCLPIVISIAVYKKLTKQVVWNSIKIETILLMTTLVCGIILYSVA